MRIERIEKSKHKQERVLVFLEGGDLLRITGAELLRFAGEQMVMLMLKLDGLTVKLT